MKIVSWIMIWSHVGKMTSFECQIWRHDGTTNRILGQLKISTLFQIRNIWTYFDAIRKIRILLLLLYHCLKALKRAMQVLKGMPKHDKLIIKYVWTGLSSFTVFTFIVLFLKTWKNCQLTKRWTDLKRGFGWWNLEVNQLLL